VDAERTAVRFVGAAGGNIPPSSNFLHPKRRMIATSAVKMLFIFCLFFTNISML
jgi:hypothetical protein